MRERTVSSERQGSGSNGRTSTGARRSKQLAPNVTNARGRARGSERFAPNAHEGVVLDGAREGTREKVVILFSHEAK
jgi:hypothetical protein